MSTIESVPITPEASSRSPRDESHREQLPPFPVQVLPEWARAWVESTAAATQTPADLGAMLVLATISATVAKKFVVEPRQGWREPLNVYVLVGMGPGNRKSAVFSAATRP